MDGATLSNGDHEARIAGEPCESHSARTFLSQLEEILFESQNERGAFVSFVEVNGQRHADSNAFITGLILRHSRGLLPSDHPSIRKALRFLEQCRASNPEGAYCFWPRDDVPLWMPVRLPADADDTAIAGLELMRAGLVSRDALRDAACYTLLPHRVETVPAFGPPWIVTGAFYTWLRDGPGNVVDCCVNVNVLALLRQCNLTGVPGYKEAINLVTRGVEWARDSPQAARSISPFYPDPRELKFAMRHAVAMGVTELESALAAVESRSWAQSGDDDGPVCASAYGNQKWYCPALHQVRRLADAIG